MNFNKNVKPEIIDYFNNIINKLETKSLEYCVFESYYFKFKAALYTRMFSNYILNKIAQLLLDVNVIADGEQQIKLQNYKSDLKNYLNYEKEDNISPYKKR